MCNYGVLGSLKSCEMQTSTAFQIFLRETSHPKTLTAEGLDYTLETEAPKKNLYPKAQQIRALNSLELLNKSEQQRSRVSHSVGVYGLRVWGMSAAGIRSPSSSMTARASPLPSV